MLEHCDIYNYSRSSQNAKVIRKKYKWCIFGNKQI